MFSFFKNISLKRRLIKTLERLKFKKENPNSKLYGHFTSVEFYETQEYTIYGVGDVQIREYKKDKKIVLFKDQKQQMALRDGKTNCIMNIKYLNKIFDKIDDVTNNDTR
jgi:hypothetical protein